MPSRKNHRHAIPLLYHIQVKILIVIVLKAMVDDDDKETGKTDNAPNKSVCDH